MRTDHRKPVKAVRQLRRIRSFYTGGFLLWAASAAWTGWDSPGGRQMWASLLLLALFAALLLTASVLLRRIEAAPSRPSHGAAPRTPAAGTATALAPK
ncbi:hypothetical protein [Streptomyces sp. t39]|uniref:hypothetical protein n=1 Tax=Streptomyces sp. t39 TaxID=1828156 RepID=UPI0011CE3788|nr:hypothetical protein [Streptomyces sp. t39]TXS52041.1 hypothetical protein EAO77_21995 [Streptomyces sp. t39]